MKATIKRRISLLAGGICGSSRGDDIQPGFSLELPYSALFSIAWQFAMKAQLYTEFVLRMGCIAARMLFLSPHCNSVAEKHGEKFLSSQDIPDILHKQNLVQSCNMLHCSVCSAETTTRGCLGTSRPFWDRLDRKQRWNSLGISGSEKGSVVKLKVF